MGCNEKWAAMNASCWNVFLAWRISWLILFLAVLWWFWWNSGERWDVFAWKWYGRCMHWMHIWGIEEGIAFVCVCVWWRHDECDVIEKWCLWGGKMKKFLFGGLVLGYFERYDIEWGVILKMNKWWLFFVWVWMSGNERRRRIFKLELSWEENFNITWKICWLKNLLEEGEWKGKVKIPLERA